MSDNVRGKILFYSLLLKEVGLRSLIMKKTFTIAVFLFSLSLLQAQLEKDKVLHFGAGVLSGATGALVADQLSDGNRVWTFAGAVGGSLLAGVIKETIDQNKSNNNWDNGDLAATVLGGVTVGVTIDLFSGKKRKKNKQVNLSIH